MQAGIKDRHDVVKKETASFRPISPDQRMAQRVIDLRAELQELEANVLACRTGTEYIDINLDKGEFHLPVWGRELRLTYPDFIAYDSQTGQEIKVDSLALLLYYFRTSDGTPEAGRWISFSELPGGKFYNQAYQGYTGGDLGRAFKSNVAAFEHASQSLGGRHEPIADCAYSFRALPRVTLCVVYWRGDEDFPDSYQVLFDASAGHHLPTDVCAGLGSTLTHRLIKAHQTP